MERYEEVMNLAMAWIAVLTSLCYCYAVGRLTSKRQFRLLAFLPVISLFLLLPLSLTSLHFIGFTSFFISWLANFKLLLFAFGQGPLAAHRSSLRRFLAVACLPIKVTHHTSRREHSKVLSGKSVVKYGTKGLILALVVDLSACVDRMHPAVVCILYCLHMYLSLEITLAIAAAAARATLGVELEPQFYEPYLSTSLQDFWGRRWNLMVSSILRATVYDPLLRSAAVLVGRRWTPLAAVVATFGVSAVMHELIFYHLGRLRPTGGITCFFLLHGVSVAVEIAAKRLWGSERRRLPRLVSGVLTMGFVLATVFWLFQPELLRINADVRALEEYAAAVAFVKDLTGATRIPILTVRAAECHESLSYDFK